MACIRYVEKVFWLRQRPMISILRNVFWTLISMLFVVFCLLVMAIHGFIELLSVSKDILFDFIGKNEKAG